MLSKILLLSTVAVASFVSAESYTFRDDIWQNSTIAAKIDHTTPPTNTDTYQQRYWWTDAFIDQDKGPDYVFLYICGEGTCRPPSERGFSVKVAEDLKALFFAVEHRYYGASQPFKDWSTENLKYLNAENALADLADFIDAKNAEIIAKWKGGNRKWVTVGGSYPGALSAWFKAAYPDKATVAWSSSGVILPIRDFSDFDLDIYQATSRSGPDCPATIQALTAYIDKVLDTPKGPEYEYLDSIF